MGRPGIAALAIILVLAATVPPVSAQRSPLDLAPPVELRSIPSEAMIPALQVGDRVLVDKAAYSLVRFPNRGDVVIFQHPHSDRVMIKRVIGLPGDTVQMKAGRLHLNGKLIERTHTRRVIYIADGGALVTAEEYSEQLPGEARAHLIHEWSEHAMLDQTPVFKVPPGNFFMMGDNRDNSEDSRAPSGHRELAKQFPNGWNAPVILGDPQDDAMGFVPIQNIMGRALSVAYTLHVCNLTEADKAGGIECPASRVGKPL